MHSQHKMKSPRFKDNGFINTRLTICIFAQPNLHKSYLCSKQHPCFTQGGKNGALRFTVMHIESSKVQSLIKAVGAKLHMQIVPPPKKKLLTIWIHSCTAKNDKEDMARDGVVGVVINLAEHI